MKKILFISLLVMICACDARAKELYVITGCPNPLGPATYGSELYRFFVSGDESEAWVGWRATLIPKQNGSYFIQSYPDAGVVSLRWEGYYPGSRYTIVDMKNPRPPKTFTFSHSADSTFFRGWILDIPIKGLYQVVHIVKNKEYSLLGINLKTLVEKQIDYEDLQYAVLAGSSGVAMGGDFIDFHIDAEGSLFFGSNVIPNFFPLLPPLLPEQGKEKKNLGVYLMNGDLIAIGGGKDAESTEFHVFNRKSKEWKTYRFPGDRSIKLRCFGTWIAGYECSRKKEKIPGAEQWVNETKKFLSPNYRLGSGDMYCPGNLFVCNVCTNERFEINTDQGDSEILLIRDNRIYYRAYNCIYMVKIADSALTEPRLLMKDGVVPSIHWMFVHQSKTKRAANSRPVEVSPLNAINN